MRSILVNNSSKKQRDHFLAELHRRIAAADDAHPTVRCWFSTKLRALLSELRAKLLQEKTITSTFPSGMQLLHWIQEIGLATPVAQVLPGNSMGPKDAFYLLGAAPNSPISPFELLQAFHPAGVVAFFGALSFHGLTTQSPAFYHIAMLTLRPTTPPVRKPRRSETSVVRDNLGTLAFSYEDIPLYSTRRYADLVPGVQMHILDQKMRLRVTDIEQSLLDTLAHPGAAGGQSVIFEAWEQGWTRIQPLRMAQYAQSAATPLQRRFGAMVNLMQLPLSEEIREVLTRARQTVFAEGKGIPISLFRHAPGQKLDDEWQVLTPL